MLDRFEDLPDLDCWEVDNENFDQSKTCNSLRGSGAEASGRERTIGRWDQRREAGSGNSRWSWSRVARVLSWRLLATTLVKVHWTRSSKACLRTVQDSLVQMWHEFS